MKSLFTQHDPNAADPPRPKDPRRLRPDERRARKEMIEVMLLQIAVLSASVATGLRVGFEHRVGKGYDVFISYSMMGRAYKRDYLERATLAEAIEFLDNFSGGYPTGALAEVPERQVGGAGFLGQPYVDSLTRLR